MNRQADRPTMATIAELAGVSKITVSRALGGSALVRPELRERIVAVANEAGYRMNVAARNLRTRRSHTVAVVLEQLEVGDRPISDPVLLTVIGGLLEVLTAADQAMLLTSSEHFLRSQAIAADGVIMFGQGEGGRRAREVASCGQPMVVWGASLPGQDFPVIGSDNRQGGRIAAEHMVAGGRRRILFLGDSAHPEVAARLDGVREVLSASEAALVRVAACDFSLAAGARAAGAALDEGLDFDAVIAVSDYIAAGACDVLTERGVAIPDRVAVIGFDDNPIAAAHRPPISSIRQDWARAGRVLGETLLQLLDGKGRRPGDQLLPVELVARRTTAGPRR
ncbi:MAG: hypothetical protein JWP35_1943 [Caulobacter sp.]|nr:hypothetical protein [Caulobacter sp.]